jgi:hypothetical protein
MQQTKKVIGPVRTKITRDRSRSPTQWCDGLSKVLRSFPGCVDSNPDPECAGLFSVKRRSPLATKVVVAAETQVSLALSLVEVSFALMDMEMAGGAELALRTLATEIAGD